MDALFQQIAVAALKNTWRTNIVPAPNGKAVHFYDVISVTITPSSEGDRKYVCEISDLILRVGQTPQDAFFNAVEDLWQTVERSICSPTHTLTNDEVVVKGQIIAAVHLGHTNVTDHEPPETKYMLCRLVDDGGILWAVPCSSDYEHLRFEIPTQLLGGSEKPDDLIQVVVGYGEDDEPSSPVQQIIKRDDNSLVDALLTSINK